MSRSRKYDLGIHALIAISATGDGTLNTVEWWRDTGAVGKVRVTWCVLQESQAGMVTRPATQTVDAESDVPTDTPLGADTKTGTGMRFPSAWVNISSGTDGKQRWRLAMYAKNASGTSLNVVRVQIWLEIDEAG